MISPLYSKCIVSLDCPLEKAKEIIYAIGDRITMYKVHALYDEFPKIIEVLKLQDKQGFLDLKLHDTPNTTKLRVEALAQMQVDYLTVHIDTAMNKELISNLNSKINLVGVSYLTSWLKYDTKEYLQSVLEYVHSDIEHGLSVSMQNFICPGPFVEEVKSKYQNKITTFTPGIKYPNSSTPGQYAHLTAKQVIDAGGDYIILGSGIYNSGDPVQALENILNL